MTNKREEKITPEIIRGESTPVIFAEGLTQIMLGFPNSRLVMHNRVEQKIEGESIKETRYIAYELVMPTSAILELAKQIMSHVASNSEILKNAESNWSIAVNNLIDSADPK